MRVYYTEDIRENDMGVITLGDPSVDLIGTKLPEGKSSVEFDCPGVCTETYFEVSMAQSVAWAFGLGSSQRKILLLVLRRCTSTQLQLPDDLL